MIIETSDAQDTRMAKVLDILSANIDGLLKEIQNGGDVSRINLENAAVSYAHAFQAVQTYRLASAIDQLVLLEMGDVTESVHRIATAIEMIEKR